MLNNMRLKVVIVCLMIAQLSGCGMPKSIKNVFAQAQALEAKQQVYFNEYDIHWGLNEQKHLKKVSYVSSAPTLDTTKPTIIFIHGTPGDWKIFAQQLASEKLKKAANLIAIERPGWGFSQYTDGSVETSLNTQAVILANTIEYIAKQLQTSNEVSSTVLQQKIVLVGHSFGATLVPFILKELQELQHTQINIHQAHLWAGNLSAKHQKTRWYNKAAKTTVVKLFLGSNMKKSNVEMLALNKELKAIDALWPLLKTPLVIVQGKKDKLVDPNNITFAQTIKTQSIVKVKALNDIGHLFMLTKLGDIEDELLAPLLDE